jgi:hypothetical protein
VAEKAVTVTWEPPAGAPLPPTRTLTAAELIGAAAPATAGAALAAGAKPDAQATGTAAPAAKPSATAGAAPAAAAAAAVPAPVPPTPLASTPRGMHLPVLLGYNVYVVGTPAEQAAAATAIAVAAAPNAAPTPVPAGTPAPVPLNAAPLATPTFSDSGFQFGVERCYQVRAVNALGLPSTHAAPTLPIPGQKPAPPPPTLGPPRPPRVALPPVWFESPASAKTCVTPIDVFAPPVPQSLSAVGSVGTISLIWEGVDAADLAGYLVLRGPAPDGPMTPLFDAPIRETTYRDTSVKPGVHYVYTVISVDQMTPPNRSAPSNKAAETAR